jgi:hypothetical protein
MLTCEVREIVNVGSRIEARRDAPVSPKRYVTEEPAVFADWPDACRLSIPQNAAGLIPIPMMLHAWIG